MGLSANLYKVCNFYCDNFRLTQKKSAAYRILSIIVCFPVIFELTNLIKSAFYQKIDVLTAILDVIFDFRGKNPHTDLASRP